MAEKLTLRQKWQCLTHPIQLYRGGPRMSTLENAALGHVAGPLMLGMIGLAGFEQWQKATTPLEAGLGLAVIAMGAGTALALELLEISSTKRAYRIAKEELGYR